MTDPTSPLHGRPGLYETTGHPVTRALTSLCEAHDIAGAVLVTFASDRVSVTSSAPSAPWAKPMERLGDLILAQYDDGAFDSVIGDPAAAPTGLTPRQKLNALALHFYQGLRWEPKAGDYYTTSRADLELYQVVEVRDGTVFTRYTDRPGPVTEWDAAGFLTEGFGPKRVWVPPVVLEQIA